MKLIWLHQQNFRRHDPKKIVMQLAQGLKGIKDYVHQEDPFEVVFQNSISYQKIHKILANLPDDKDTQ